MKYVLAALLIAAAPAYSKTLVVNNNSANTASPCKTAGYTTISSAITAAAAGDTVDVCPGTYPEAVLINKANIKLLGIPITSTLDSSLITLMPTAGIAASDPEDSTTETTVLLVDSVSGVTISNISVNGSQASTNCGSGNTGIYFRNASGSIINSSVAYVGLNGDGTLTGCQEGLGIYVEGAEGGTANVTITGTSVHDYDKSGIVAEGPGATLVAKSNAVTGSGPTLVTAQNGIEVDDGAKGTLESNVISSLDYTSDASAGTGIIFFASANNGVANSNILSEVNNGIYFLFTTGGTANSNNISKTVNYDAMATFQAPSVAFEKNIITRAGLEDNQPAIFLCGKSDKVENNIINEAPIGVGEDRTTADGCGAATSMLVTGNTYYGVGTLVQIVSDSGTINHQIVTRNRPTTHPRYTVFHKRQR